MLPNGHLKQLFVGIREATIENDLTFTTINLIHIKIRAKNEVEKAFAFVERMVKVP